ncbi:MAG: hypothetical protein C0501_19305 [Isosphaera sp.]|nr:hypothetical protein [Isosphaera sp.]
MALFGSGIGWEGDCCLLFVVAGGCLAVVAFAAVGARGSARAAVLSFLLAALLGAAVVPEALTHRLRDTDDSRAVHTMLWEFVWWWAVAACAPVAATVALQFRGRRPGPEPGAGPPALKTTPRNS